MADVSTSGLLPGAEPFSGGSGRRGVLLIHGFTGSPRSLRPWAEDLVARGYRVELPLLPGHGTCWQDMERTDETDWYGAVESAFDSLAAQTDSVAVCALSMGGSLALELAAHRPVAALVLVNPSVGTTDKRFLFLPVLSKVRRSIPAIGDDIAAPGVEEGAYPRTPLKCTVALTRLWRTVRSHLGQVTAPVLLFRSRTDHVVDPSSAAIIVGEVGSKEVQEVMLERSYHVATLDYDAPAIFEGCAEFLSTRLR